MMMMLKETKLQFSFAFKEFPLNVSAAFKRTDNRKLGSAVCACLICLQVKCRKIKKWMLSPLLQLPLQRLERSDSERQRPRNEAMPCSLAVRRSHLSLNVSARPAWLQSADSVHACSLSALNHSTLQGSVFLETALHTSATSESERKI